MKRPIFTALLLLALFLPAASAAPEAEPPAAISMGGTMPGGRWDGVPDRPAVKQADPRWSLRTGFRKGIVDQTLAGEVAGGPDGAVLRSGLFAESTGLLAEYRESSILVEADGIAGLAATKPYLIIPSGGLSGTASSKFFRAGLAAYARSGGIIICFTQAKGIDYSALPLPDGATLVAAGWTEDAGPLFRSSIIQGRHPALAGTRRPPPTVETDGYIISFPETARVLLARHDGFPTFILYPFGSGWVAVTTLMSDQSFRQGLLDSDEKALIRDLVQWAKSGGRTAELSAGNRFDTNLRIRGPEQGEAASVRILVMGTRQDRPVHDQTVPISLTVAQEALLPFTYDIPANSPPGIYHIEYILQDANRRQLSPPVENSDGWFAVMPQSAPPDPDRTAGAREPLAGLPARFSALPAVEHTGDRVRFALEMTRVSGPAESYDLVARFAGQERAFKMTQDRMTFSAEVPVEQAGGRIAYAVYHGSGRSLVRGSVPVAVAQTAGVSIDRPWYSPGQRIKVSVKGMGPGAFSLSGLGSVSREHISKDRTFELPVPLALPAGAYPLVWEFETRSGTRQEGVINVLVQGTHVLCSSASITQSLSGKDATVSATLQITSNEAQQAVLSLWPVSPSGAALPVQEKAVSIAAGGQEIAMTIPFKPDQAGIWSFQYSLAARLPEGPGFAPEPVKLVSGRSLLDAGVAAVLGLLTERPLYYEPAGPVVVSTVMHATDPAKFELFLDGKRIRRDTVASHGTASFSVPLTGLTPGPHTVRAAVAGKDLESSREITFIYGARLPDLTAAIKTSELSAPVMEVGVGVTNSGKVQSGAATASLYDGDPARGGRLIRTASLPALLPGKQHVFLANWPLIGNAGQHTLVAVVDQDARIIESNEGNNTAEFSLSVPEILLSLTPDKNAVRAGEQAAYKVRVLNLTATALKTLTLELHTADPAGKQIAADTLRFQDIASGDERTIDRTLEAPSPQEGIYLISAVAATDKPVASDSMGISMLPTLLLTGDLEGTPSIAANCRPFVVRFRARNAGNIPPTNGALKIEIRSVDQNQLVYAKQLPFSLEAGAATIEKLDAPRGSYTVVLRASAVNQQRGLTGEFLLAEHPLTVEGPVIATRSSVSIPRILVWSGSDESTNIERAITDKLQNEAFAGENVYVRSVRNSSDFTSNALTGLYNIYVLIDTDSAPDTAELLRDGLAKGRGIILAGSGERTRALAESLEFRFEKPLPGNAGSMTFPSDSAIGITGTIPVSGRFQPPRKQGARTVATLPDGQPAILLDVHDKGKVIVMPFPLTHSAMNAGMTALYSLLLRSTVMAVAPEHEAPEGIASTQLLVASNSGKQEKARVVETLPAGAKAVWTSMPHTVKNGALVFELTAGQEPVKILTLFQQAATGAGKASTEVFTECGGKLVSQGKVNDD